MKKIKKFIVVFILILVCCLALAACSSGNEQECQINIKITNPVDGVQISTSYGVISGSNQDYTIKIKAKKLTTIIIAAPNKKTVYLNVNVSDFVENVVDLSVTLEDNNY